jgi:uncharacterized protein (DUF2235 family)
MAGHRGRDKEAVMAKKIALFSDGTGNSSGKAQKTNVWRLFQALDQTGNEQIAKYDDGVGTSSNKYLAAIGGACGFGLKRNVIDLYKFVCRNYAAGDQIYGFGFSRGAFTIRVLVGLIAREGLVVFRSEEELIRNAAAAYRSYRSKSFRSKSPIVWFCRWVRDVILWIKDRINGYPSYAEISKAAGEAGRKEIPIHFLGLWDTVEAYGMPVEELKRGIDKVLWPMLFGDLTLSPRVRRACHALSLDDERTTFHPLLWDEVAEAKMVELKQVPAGRITQVWFAGVHSNVGGGYPEDQLSLVTLDWMMNEALANGLALDADAIKQVARDRSPYARLYNSRAGLASYYRYSPRRIEIQKDQAGTRILPIIHGSVLMRMAYGSDRYATITPPHEFWVLAPNGALLPMSSSPQSLTIDQSKSHTAGAGAARAAAIVNDEVGQLSAAIALLSRPERQTIRLVWDTVFWRRCLYALTFALTAALLAYPLVSDAVSTAMGHVPYIGQLARKTDSAAGGPIAQIVDAISGLIPSYAQPWKDALKRNPLEFFLLLLGIGLSLAGSSVLENRIHDRARLAWHHRNTDRYHQWVDASRNAFRNGVLVALALSGIAFVIALLGDAETNTRVGFLVLIGCLALLLVLHRLGHREVRHGGSGAPSRATFALLLARWLRDNRVLKAVYGASTQHVIPYVFAGLIVVAGLIAANRAVFDMVSSAGYFCQGTSKLDETIEKLGAGSSPFATDRMCWASGLVLKKGHRYVITIETPGDWFDRTTHTDVLGFPADGPRHVVATPLKRWWGQNWFKPIARIGALGNNELPLDPIDDVSPHTSPECPPIPGPKHVRDKITPSQASDYMKCDPTPDDRRVLKSEIKASADGELFIYVNDAVWGIPGPANMFFDKNTGSGTVSVSRVATRLPTNE